MGVLVGAVRVSARRGAVAASVAASGSWGMCVRVQLWLDGGCARVADPPCRCACTCVCVPHQVMVEEAEAVVPRFEPTGFFGLAPQAVRKVGGCARERRRRASLTGAMFDVCG